MLFDREGEVKVKDVDCNKISYSKIIKNKMLYHLFVWFLCLLYGKLSFQFILIKLEIYGLLKHWITYYVSDYFNHLLEMVLDE